MEWNIDKIEDIIKYINIELASGKTMVKIEQEIFNVNKRVIHKRLERLGYKKIDNQYIFIGKSSTKGIKASDKKKNDTNKSITNVIQEPQRVIQSDFKEDDIKALKELITLIEPLKNVIQEYNNNTTNNKYIDIEPIEIKINRKKLSGNIKQVGFRIDETILEEWKEFIKNYVGEYKVQDLIGEALRQFINKYRK